MVDEVGGCLDHPAGTARRAKATALAREGHEVLMAAAVALHPYETMLQAAAAQILPELVNHEAWQRRIALAQVLEECVEVCLDQRIQRRLLGASRPERKPVADQHTT
jgi:hypothetical protein